LNTLKVMIIFGTRPEAVKMAPVIRELERHPNVLKPRICNTGQHSEMLAPVLDLFSIQPDHDLNVMKSGQGLFNLSSRILMKLRSILQLENPDIVLVQGDTTSTLIGSLAAFYLQIPLGHIEAGLRTGDKHQPFPEEMNRRLVDCLADWYFCPTAKDKDNLINEGFNPEKLYVTGNTGVDALLQTAEMQKDPQQQDELRSRFESEYKVLLNTDKTILVTTHRRENFGPGIKNICSAIIRMAEDFPQIQVVFPVHLNPNVRATALEMLSSYEKIHLIEPVEYALFVYLMTRSYFILTDSGGIQEEAPSLGKPVLVMRNKTERTEGIEAGTARLVGTDPDIIYQEAKQLLSNNKLYSNMARAVNPYGDGKASTRIVDILAGRNN